MKNKMYKRFTHRYEYLEEFLVSLYWNYVQKNLHNKNSS